MRFTMKIVAVVCLLVCRAEAQPDPTIAEGAGWLVVEEAIQRINDSNCFADDCGILHNIALQTNYGSDNYTYDNPGYHGGIWQVDEIRFLETQDVLSHPGLTAKINCIQTELSIDWTTVTWMDLRKPLYSAIAARLWLNNNPNPIPKPLESQATHWLFPNDTPLAVQTFVILAQADALKVGGKGKDVTKQAIKLVTNSGCFPPDHGFLLCLAWVESQYGNHKQTYRNGPPAFHGGIWQVSKEMFDDIKTAVTVIPNKVQDKINCIKMKYHNLDWVTDVKWEDLRRPAYSAAAAMLYLCTGGKPAIPDNQKDQCEFWEKHWLRGDDDDIILTQTNRTRDYWLKSTNSKGDPHMQQLISGSKSPLCYDIVGNEGDIYSLYTNPETNVYVNIRLTGIRKGDKGIYIGEVILIVGNTRIEVTLGSVSFNGEPKQMWMTQTWHDENKTAEVTIEARKLVIDLELTQIRIVKNRRWLDVDMSQIGAFGQNDGGVFGFLGNHAQIEEHNLGANLVVTNVAQNTTDVYSLHSKPHHCWRIFKKGHDDFSQFLKNHIIK